MNVIDEFFIIRVSDYQHELLSRPRKKAVDKSESLSELPIISVETGVWSIV